MRSRLSASAGSPQRFAHLRRPAHRKPTSGRSLAPPWMLRRNSNGSNASTPSALHGDHEEQERLLAPRSPRRNALHNAAAAHGNDTSHHKRGGASTLGWHRLKSIKILGLEPSPELFAISMVYFVQGILGLSRLAVSFYCKDDLALDPATVASLTTLGAIPWFIKPLYGFISDSLPLFGYHRRSYLVLAGLLGFSGWTALAWAVDSPGGLVAVLLITALGTASSDVVVDSLVVERARGHPQEIAGSLQSLCWSSAAVGGVLSAYWSGALVEHYGTRFVFGLTALFPLIVSFSALLINEQRVTYSGGRPMGPPRGAPSASAAENGWGGGQGEEESSRLLSQSDKDTAADTGAPQAAVQLSEAGLGQQLLGRARLLWGALKGRGVFMPTVFIFVWNATPSYSDAMFFFTTNELGFEPEFLGRVRLVSSLASLGGVLLYNTLLKQTPIRTLLWYAMLLGVALGSTQLLLVSGLNRQLGLSDQLFALGDTALLTALSQASTMPILVLAARLCPEGVEATLFATLMSVFNLGSHAGELLGAGLTKALGITSNNFNHLFTLVVICNIAQLLPAPLLRFIPDALTGVEAEEAAAKEARREQGREDGEGNDDDDNDEFGPPGGGESSAPGTTATSVVLVADHGPQARGDGAVVSADVELLPRRSHKPAWQVGLHDVASSPQRRLKLG